MLTVIVEFTDETETVIKSKFDAPQEPEDHPFMGEVEEGDERYIAFLSHFPPTNPWA